ncbi:START domain-containing protein [Mucilaginibacter paludis]|uniref:Lipid-binding START domain protein n=1 Tax=Mucilaginibacter paludis DSM 18603 TaxID=714943 RepID=H1Y1E0_9SPHI|nr:START domain-containing protein [Mucilaginibacter paludis]EHQ30274.1 lipid-binding START domain protein [Mucilaginibacter paludis DSM 18603]
MKKIGVSVLLLISQIICYAQEKWTLRKDENGIAVYSRMLGSEKYKEIRVVCEFDAPAEKLVKVLQNVKDHKNWVYKTIRSYQISRKNKDTLYYYSEIALPWPASNRDATVQLAVATDSLGTFTITVKSMPNLTPAKPNLVRVPYSVGTYKVNSLPGNRIRVDYTLSVDPGGSIPAWLVNYTATVAPYYTFVKLKALVEK